MIAEICEKRVILQGDGADYLASVWGRIINISTNSYNRWVIRVSDHGDDEVSGLICADFIQKGD